MILFEQHCLLITCVHQQNTALHIAAQVGHEGAVLMLLDRGAEITLNNADNSFLHEAVRNEKKDVVNAVIESERYGNIHIQDDHLLEDSRPIHFTLKKLLGFQINNNILINVVKMFGWIWILR